MAAAPLSRVVPAGAIDTSKEMAPLLRLLDLSSNSRSGDANEERVSAINKRWSSSVANPLKDLLARRDVGSGRTVDCRLRACLMGQLDDFFGCGAKDQRSQSDRRADTVRCSHAASRLCELVRRTQLLSQILVWFFRTLCSPRQMC